MAIDRRMKTPKVEKANWISKTFKTALKIIATAWQYKTGKNNLSKMSHGTSFEIDVITEPRRNDVCLSARYDKRLPPLYGTFFNEMEN